VDRRLPGVVGVRRTVGGCAHSRPRSRGG
jgi:hypothetical protein